LLARVQQLTGPVMAKGVEDTAFYLHGRLLALNEVGGSPDRFGMPVEEFHRTCQQRLTAHPRAMLATSTHDTKRSEDVRARLCLLSEIPERWAEVVERLISIAGRHRSGDAPDGTFEYLYYQTLVGAWPLDRDRAVAYMTKAAREARARTSWTRPDETYEAALTAFVEGTLSDPSFVEIVQGFVAPLVWPGRVNALAQTLIKLTAPGVPDIYQGTELWDLSLVHPDNRRPVDFDHRRRLLGALAGASPEQVLARTDEGLPKLWVVRQALALRHERSAGFGAGAPHVPLAARGRRAEHVVAYARGREIVTVVPRWPLRLAGDWADTAVILPEGRWENRLTGERVDGGIREIGDLLARFPVALLAIGA
jgi:(1->4)-alpha-D-glucan 1-alpha-D-glucosylmutase